MARAGSELRSLWLEHRRTVMFVTHSVEEAVVLGSRALVMSARPGRVVLDLPLPVAGPDVPSAEVRALPEAVAAAERIRTALDG
jgi:ABC-type nitrate/sulfonate/bicarbonate transport system ATPase subunit